MPVINRLLSDAIEEYLGHRRAQGLRPNTVKVDQTWLRKFLTHTGNIYIRNVTVRHVDSFFSGNQQWGAATRNLIVTILRTFFRYARRQRWMQRDDDPMGDYRTRPVPKKEMLRVPVSEFSALMDSAKHPRNRMMIALGLFLFLRASEVQALKVDDVSLETSEIVITVVKKGDVQDVMMINSQLDRELRRYLTWYAETHGELKGDWLLVPSKNSMVWKNVHGRLVPDVEATAIRMRPNNKINNPEKVIQESLRKLGYPTYMQGFHTLRRSGARAFYDELCDRQSDNSALEVVSAMLHHESLVQTQVYLGVTESKKRRNRAVMEGPMFPALEPAENVIQMIREAPYGPRRNEAL